MKYSVIVTAKNEPKTVGQLIGQIEDQMSKIGKNFEIILVCPDKKTKESAISRDRLQKVKWLKDKAQGKPSALNIAFTQAKGKILILTDGDVSLAEGALKELLGKIVGINKAGLITGRPVPVNRRNNLFGFWSHFLTQAAHQQRSHRHQNNFYMDGSGYLMAIRKELVKQMPKNILVDDAWLSYQVWNQGYKIEYAQKAKVEVKFPTNLSDWVTQKKRTLSGHLQLKKIQLKHDHSMRGFFEETKGLKLAFTYPKNIKEYFWILLLIVIRFYVWLVVYWERKILKKSYSGNWKRIESTK